MSPIVLYVTRFGHARRRSSQIHLLLSFRRQITCDGIYLTSRILSLPFVFLALDDDNVHQ